MTLPSFSYSRQANHFITIPSTNLNFEDYVVFVMQELQALHLPIQEHVAILEEFQLWILKHFGIVLDVFASVT